MSEPQPEMEVPPSSAPGAPPAPPARAALRARLERVVRGALEWPAGNWPAPTGTSLFFISLLLVAAVELLPKTLSDITLTVHARTEVLELTLQPARTYVWWLPAGQYSLLTPTTAAACAAHELEFDVTCGFAEPTAVTITGGATARFELTPGAAGAQPHFTMTLTPRGSTGADAATGSRFEIRAQGTAEAIATAELVTFAAPAEASWRIPLIVERVQIGDFLSESIAGEDALGVAHQPIMTEGDVRMFARSLGFEERYQVQEERFDPADVVQIPADTATTGLLLGLLSLPTGDERSKGFDVTLHTNVAEVFVRRLGAEHRIGVSTWSVISKLPLWLALWVVWAALVTLANYYSARSSRTRG